MYRVIILFLFISHALHGQQINTMQSEAEVASPPATIESAAWITGAWSGEGLGGYCDVKNFGGVCSVKFRTGVRRGKIQLSQNK